MIKQTFCPFINGECKNECMFHTIKALAKLNKLTIGQILSDCELSKNTLSSMQSGGYLPRVENLTKIADYLDCSVDYLLGRTDNPEINK